MRHRSRTGGVSDSRFMTPRMRLAVVTLALCTFDLALLDTILLFLILSAD